MGNNKNKCFLSIIISIFCLTFLFFLFNSAPLIYADLPPLDPGSQPGILPGNQPSAPPGGGYFPQFGAPYGSPYQNPGFGFIQNPGFGFMPPAGQYGLPFQDPGFGFMPPAGQYGLPFQDPGFGFMPPAGQYGLPFQNQGFGNMPPNFMPTGAPYGFPPQTPIYNIPPSGPYGPINPNVPPSFDTSGTNTAFPVYNTGYNPAAFPNQAFYGPAPNMYAPPNVFQQGPGLSAYDPTAAAQGNINPFVNPFGAPYGNMAPFPGGFPQQGFPGGNFPGYNPFQPVNPWQQPWSPFGTNINPYNPNNPYQPGYNPGTYYPDPGGGGGDKDPDPVPVDLPDALGHWAGSWEIWLIDPNEGVATDPNGQIIITMSGDIRFEITEQPSDGGAVLGTIEITGWDVDPQPQDWPGDWTGESDEVALTGWIDSATRYLKARYFYYPGNEALADYDANEDPVNIKGLYTWYFNTNKLTITDTGISGQFSITGTDGYYQIGVFNTGKYIP